VQISNLSFLNTHLDSSIVMDSVNAESVQNYDSAAVQRRTLYDFTDESILDREHMKLSRLDRIFRANTIISTESHKRRTETKWTRGFRSYINGGPEAGVVEQRTQYMQLEKRPYYTPSRTAPNNKWVLS
jgi:hypothetical protein